MTSKNIFQNEGNEKAKDMENEEVQSPLQVQAVSGCDEVVGVNIIQNSIRKNNTHPLASPPPPSLPKEKENHTHTDPHPSPYEARKVEYECQWLRKRIIFDAVGVQFHINIFLWQLLVHLFIFLFPLLRNPRAQGFVSDVSLRMRFNVLLPLITYMVPILYFVLPTEDQSLLRNYVWIPILFFSVHRVVLSLKYGSLSETEYERFNNCTCEELSREYLRQMQLLDGWYRMEADVLYFELGAASARMGERINNFHLVIPAPHSSPAAYNQYLYWNAFIRGQTYVSHSSRPAPELKLLPCGNYALSVYDLCLSIILNSQSLEKKHGGIWLLVRTLVLAIILISFVPVLFQASKIQAPVVVSFFLICSYYSIWWYGIIFFHLLYVASFDALRQKQMVAFLHSMVRLTELMMHNQLALMNSTLDCSKAYAEDRVRAVLSMNEQKAIGCRHDEDDIEACRAFYSSDWSTPVTISSAVMPLLEGAQDEEELLPQQIKEGESLTAIDGVADEHSHTSSILGETFADEASCARVPRITFQHPQNVLAWTYARLALQNFGDRFRFRMDCYIGKLLRADIMLLIFFILTFIDRETQSMYGPIDIGVNDLCPRHHCYISDC